MKLASHIDKNLPYMLENVCYVYGGEELVKMCQSYRTFEYYKQQ